MGTNRCRQFNVGGFTVVELLVVIAIIGILVSLLLPAVLQAREAGRRAGCVSNLRQIGMASQNFHDTYRHFPPAHFQDPNQIANNYGQPRPYGDSYYFSWLTRILPYIEQKNIYDAVDFDEWAFPNPSTPLPDGGYLNGKVVAMYQCPSMAGDQSPYEIDFSDGPVRIAHTDYLGVSGTDQFLYDGILHINSRVRIADVLDGTSNTFLVGERPRTLDRYAGWWFAGSGWYPWFGAADVVLGTEERIAVSGESTPDGPRSFYQSGSARFEDDGYGWDKHAWHFWSFHRGGALFAFADGHVKFVPYETDKDVFRGLGTYKKAEQR